MLIKALCEYDDFLQSSLNDDEKIPEGYSAQDVQYEIEITLKNGKKKINKKNRTVLLPKRTQKSAIFSNIIEHRPLYIFGLNYTSDGFAPEDKTDKAKKSHKQFRDKNLEIFEDIDSEISSAYCNFIRNWKADEQTENEHLKSLGKNYQTANFCFGLDGHPEIMLHNDENVRTKYDEIYSAESDEESTKIADKNICGILGEQLPGARIHEKIRGVAGGNSTGCVLVGINETAFESYGKTQGFNTGISESAMKKYTGSLNYLLRDNTHKMTVDEMTIVFFAMSMDDKKECDIFSNLFGDNASAEKEEQIESIISQMKDGIRGDLSAFDFDENVTFYVVGLAPNSSRISQKFMYRDKFGKFVENILTHQVDLSISDKAKQIPFWQIKRELISPKSNRENVPPPLISAIFRAVLNGTNYPDALLSTCVRRVKIDSDDDKNHYIKLNDTRAGIIKACLNRKARLMNKKEEIKMALDVQNKNQAYLCGRLFAVLEKIQQDASGGKLNRTIKDSFFSSACSKPATVFPRIIILSQNHLKKLDNPLYLSKLSGEIINELPGEFPQTLSLDEQGKFIIGYYQQNKSLYTKKESPKNEKEQIENTQTISE